LHHGAPDSEPNKDQTPKPRYALVSIATFGLFCFSCAAAAFVVWQEGIRNPVAYALAFLIPAVAAILLELAALALPSLVTKDRLIFPQNLTLPTLYAATIIVLAVLDQQSPLAIAALKNVPRCDRIWASLPFLTIVWLGQIILFSLTLAVQRPKDRHEDNTVP